MPCKKLLQGVSDLKIQTMKARDLVLRFAAKKVTIAH